MEEKESEDKFKEKIWTPKPCSYFYQLKEDGSKVYPMKEKDGNKTVES